jgi:hypothetical protein
MASPIQEPVYNITKPFVRINVMYEDDDSVCKSINELDCFDLFGDYFLSLSPRRRIAVVGQILSKFIHPHIPYVLKTMDSTNAYNVMAYLRSLKFVELYNIIEDIVKREYSSSDDSS